MGQRNICEICQNMMGFLNICKLGPFCGILYLCIIISVYSVHVKIVNICTYVCITDTNLYYFGELFAWMGSRPSWLSSLGWFIVMDMTWYFFPWTTAYSFWRFLSRFVLWFLKSILYVLLFNCSKSLPLHKSWNVVPNKNKI